jgi:hypothetical protein
MAPEVFGRRPRARIAGWALAVALGVLGMLHAEGTPSGVQPVRVQPSVKTAITAGFRDWGPATLAGDTIIGTNMTGRGGVFVTLDGGLWVDTPKSLSRLQHTRDAPLVEARPVAGGRRPM